MVETQNHPSLEEPSNTATLLIGRYESKHIDKAFIKEELEIHGKKLRLMSCYHKEEKRIHCYSFKEKIKILIQSVGMSPKECT